MAQICNAGAFGTYYFLSVQSGKAHYSRKAKINILAVSDLMFNPAML